MNKLDLIIDALELAKQQTIKSVMYPAGYHMMLAQALAAAHELKALKPMAWVTRRNGYGGRVLNGFETCDSDEYGAIPVYILDEVTK